MKFNWLLPLALLFSTSIYAQSWGDSTYKKKEVFHSVEVTPKFIGGMKALYKFIGENLLIPKDKAPLSSKRIVTAGIIIDKKGNIVFAEIIQGVSPVYNQSVLDLLKGMPKWSAGTVNNNPVICYQSIPVLFLDED